MSTMSPLYTKDLKLSKNRFMLKEFDIKFEKAIDFLKKYLPTNEETSRKPVLPHDLRVGVYLYENGYSEEFVLAGLLHDIIEWSSVTEEMLRNEFGDNVAKLVLANTKDYTINDSKERLEESIKRCVLHGQGALVVKAADILDSFNWYSKQNNKDELRYCKRNIEAILKYKPDDFGDKIFRELAIWQK